MEGTPKAIEIQGIKRNATKIGVSDGQSEDLINLRFIDGSWRASGDGRIINYTMNRAYSQLYVHTNIYRHLLGVYDGTLYWFATIDADGVTFSPLGTPVALTTVVGDIWITQTGHLLTIIDEADDFEYIFYDRSKQEYRSSTIDVNGKASDRKIFPFGKINFNMVSAGTTRTSLPGEDTSIGNSQNIFDGDHDLNHNYVDTFFNADLIHNKMITMYADETAKNRFTDPFLVVACLKDYDGKYHYASPPMLMNYGEALSRMEYIRGRRMLQSQSGSRPLYTYDDGYYIDDTNNNIFEQADSTTSMGASSWPDGQSAPSDRYYHIPNAGLIINANESQYVRDPEVRDWDIFVGGGGAEDTDTYAHVIRGITTPGFSAGIHFDQIYGISHKHNKPYLQMTSANLAMSIDDELLSFLQNNEDLFQSVAIFITPMVWQYSQGTGGNKGEVNYLFVSNREAFGVYKPYVYSKADVLHMLTHYSFYLLREYTWKEIIDEDLLHNPIVDLSAPKYSGLLSTISSKTVLDIEAMNRTTYIPKVTYYYNNRLHIANYKAHTFYGYPIDTFILNNHAVKHVANSMYEGVLRGLADDHDDCLQYHKDKRVREYRQGLIEDGVPYVVIKTYLDIGTGEQIVTRYVPAYDPSNTDGFANFIEDLSPLLTFPDTRARKMEIYYLWFDTLEEISGGGIGGNEISGGFHSGLHVKKGSFDLTPFPYLGMSYYMNSTLKPIKIADFEDIYLTGEQIKALVEQVNTEEYFPNGLKVSSSDNPLNFPVENTYQVGSSEILALMSNTIAVGTGQTGAAPLYVFCADGVYALFVDASGQMTYSNSRVLARDVCNNPRSVTPIDAGVVFTTDRGLMMIAGEQVEEIGQPAEGDVLRYADVTTGNPEFIREANRALRKVAELPDIVTATDFLTYLKDEGTKGKAALINYNHNLRELIVCNPNYPYSYVMDRDGNWSRRDYTAEEFVNNFPTSYRLTDEGEFHKLDEEGENNTPLEERKEADNSIFYLSREIKLDSIGFKQGYRFVVRGYFETQPVTSKTTYKPIVDITSDDLEQSDSFSFMDDTEQPSVAIDDVLQFSCRTRQYGFIKQEYTVTDISIDRETDKTILRLSDDLDSRLFSERGTVCSVKKKEAEATTPRVCCSVFGSYDGRKWALLGRNERQGDFTDIGCKVERTDVKFFRVCLAGQVTGKTRIDYMEMSASGSVLNTKIR